MQVSADAPPDGSWGYQFDLPLHDWALPHKGRIELEARSRGLKPTTTSNGGWEFLDIDFTDRDQHEDFVRWVVTKVFELSEELEFEITWG